MKFFKLSNGRAMLAAAAALAFAAATSGVADAGQLDVNSYRIAFDPADAATPAGAARLARRLEWAANVVCGDAFTRRLDEHLRFEACRRDALGRAVRDVNIPTLTALAQSPGAPVTVAGR